MIRAIDEKCMQGGRKRRSEKESEEGRALTSCMAACSCAKDLRAINNCVKGL
jgi:hypothetical protein